MNSLFEKIKIAVMYLVLAIGLVFVLFPIFYMVVSSFKSNIEIMAGGANFFPVKWSMDNYITAWNSDVFNVKRLIWNSIYYTVLVVLFTAANSCIAGYVFARGRFKGKKLWFGVFTALMFVNFGGANILPTLQIIAKLHLSGSLSGLIVVKFFGINVVNIYLVKSFVSSLPKELDEAAMIDGCSFFGIFRRIIAPLLLPIVATVVMLGFQGSWNEYLMPMVFTASDPLKGTLVSGLFYLKSSGGAATNWNILLAGSVIASIPVLIVYLYGNKYFIQGLTAGAVKG